MKWSPLSPSGKTRKKHSHHISFMLLGYQGRLTPRELGHLASADWLEGCLLPFRLHCLQRSFRPHIHPSSPLSSLVVSSLSEFWHFLLLHIFCHKCFSEKSFWDPRLTPHSGRFPYCLPIAWEQIPYPSKPHKSRRCSTTPIFPRICLNPKISFLSPLTFQTWLFLELTWSPCCRLQQTQTH